MAGPMIGAWLVRHSHATAGRLSPGARSSTAVGLRLTKRQLLATLLGHDCGRVSMRSDIHRTAQPTGLWTVTGYGQPIAVDEMDNFLGCPQHLGEACGFPTLPTAPADLEGGRLEKLGEAEQPLLGECPAFDFSTLPCRSRRPLLGELSRPMGSGPRRDLCAHRGGRRRPPRSTRLRNGLPPGSEPATRRTLLFSPMVSAMNVGCH
jgi:hypothetical protein